MFDGLGAWEVIATQDPCAALQNSIITVKRNEIEILLVVIVIIVVILVVIIVVVLMVIYFNNLQVHAAGDHKP